MNLFKRLFKKTDRPHEEQLRDLAFEFVEKNFPKMLKKWVQKLDEENKKR